MPEAGVPLVRAAPWLGLLGNSPRSSRLVSVLFGLASVPFLWIAVNDAHTQPR